MVVHYCFHTLLLSCINLFGPTTSDYKVVVARSLLHNHDRPQEIKKTSVVCSGLPDLEKGNYVDNELSIHLCSWFAEYVMP